MILKNKLNSKWILVLISTASLVFFQSCMVQRPSVTDAAALVVGFLHSASIENCNQCHEKNRPLPVGSVIHGNNKDCMGCHVPGTTWATVNNGHSPIATSCNTCHSAERPASTTKASIGLSLPNHFGTNDCFLCHVVKGQTALPWKPFNHKNAIGGKGGRDAAGTMVVGCNSCHEQNRPATVAGGGAHEPTLDCVSCHYTPDAAVNPLPGWLPAIISHTPAPASCLACHTSDKPAGTVPNKYNGFDHNSQWGTECRTCHLANVGTSWSGGYFDHGPGGSVVKTVTCSPCHDQRQHKSGQLCSNCHSPSYPTGGGGGRWDEP